MDFILNGSAHGSVANLLMQTGFNTNALRPYSLPTGRRNRWGQPEYAGTYITVNENGKEVPKLVNNATTTLRKDDWVHLDQAIVKAAKPRLRAVAELRGRGLVYSIPNGMGKTVLQTQTQSDISEADVSMNGVRRTSSDRPVFELTNLPLPIIHKDFDIYLRELEASRNSGSPLDTTTAELASRRVAEVVEKLAIGSYGTYKYGGGYIYGMINFPNRLTKELTDPTDSAWTPATLVREVLSMKQKSQDALHYGPWILFNAPAWDEHLDDDYSSAKGDNTLRERLEKIQDIAAVMTLDYLSNYDMVLVQLTTDVIREVVGMDIQTLQWESHGGLVLHFKVMTIQVPQVRADQNDKTGIVHGSVA